MSLLKVTGKTIENWKQYNNPHEKYLVWERRLLSGHFYIQLANWKNFYLYFYLGDYLQWMGTAMKKVQGTVVENQGKNIHL